MRTVGGLDGGTRGGVGLGGGRLVLGHAGERRRGGGGGGIGVLSVVGGFPRQTVDRLSAGRAG